MAFDDMNSNAPPPDFTTPDRRTIPLLQGDSELIYSFSQPDAKEYDKEFEHLNKDLRMSNLKDADINFLNAAMPAIRMGSSFLGSQSPCVKHLIHDCFFVENQSVGVNGFAMQTLVTRKQQQSASIVRETKGFMSKKNDEEQGY